MRGIEGCYSHDENVMTPSLETSSENMDNPLSSTELVDVVRAQDNAGHEDSPKTAAFASIDCTSRDKSSMVSNTGYPEGRTGSR